MIVQAQAEQFVERGKQLAEDGKQHQLIVRNRDGSPLVSTNATVVVGVSLLLLVTGFLSLPLVAIVALIGYWKGLRVEYTPSQA